MPALLAGIFQAVPDAFESVWNFFYAGKLFMLFLLALSVLSITVIIYKARDLRRRRVLPDQAVDAIHSAPTYLGQRETGEIATTLRSSQSVLGRLGLFALSGDHADKADASRAVEARAREEIVELESGVALLEVVITIAPLLGLLGTVSGLVSVFSNLGESAEHSAIAIGIAEALNTTIAGLAIAVPTVVAHSFFMKKIEKMGVRMEILLEGLLASRFRNAPAGLAEIEPAPAVVPETAPIPRPKPVVTEEASEDADLELYTAIADPGANTYPEPHPPVETPAPEPQPDPAFPRLLAGHPQPAAQPAAQLDDPGSDLPHAPTIPLENQ